MDDNTEQLNRQILTVLYANNAYWNRCGGAEQRNGMTDEDLLTALNQSFPNTFWTLRQLRRRLQLGLRQGLFKTQNVNFSTCGAAAVAPLPPLPFPTTYYANNAMAVERYPNHIYADIAPRLICIPCCRRIIAPIV